MEVSPLCAFNISNACSGVWCLIIWYPQLKFSHSWLLCMTLFYSGAKVQHLSEFQLQLQFKLHKWIYLYYYYYYYYYFCKYTTVIVQENIGPMENPSKRKDVTYSHYMINSGTRTMEDYYVTSMYINVKTTNIRQQCRSCYRGILFTTLKNLKHLLFCHLAERHTVRILPSLLLIMSGNLKADLLQENEHTTTAQFRSYFNFIYLSTCLNFLKKRSVLKILKKGYSRASQYYARS